MNNVVTWSADNFCSEKNSQQEAVTYTTVPYFLQ